MSEELFAPAADGFYRNARTRRGCRAVVAAAGCRVRFETCVPADVNTPHYHWRRVRERSWPASRWQWFDFAPRRGACPCHHTIGGAGRSPGSISSRRRWRWRRRRSAGLSLLVAAAALPCTTVRRRHYHCRRWLTAGSCAARVLLAPPPPPFRRPPRDPH